MAKIIDLRAFVRRSGKGVIADIGAELVRVIDISVAGIRIARPQADLCRNVEFRIIPLSGEGVDLHRAIPVYGHVVGQGEDHVRIAFATMSIALANIIGTCQDQESEDGEFLSWGLPAGGIDTTRVLSSDPSPPGPA